MGRGRLGDGRLVTTLEPPGNTHDANQEPPGQAGREEPEIAGEPMHGRARTTAPAVRGSCTNGVPPPPLGACGRARPHQRLEEPDLGHRLALVPIRCQRRRAVVTKVGGVAAPRGGEGCGIYCGLTERCAERPRREQLRAQDSVGDTQPTSIDPRNVVLSEPISLIDR